MQKKNISQPNKKTFKTAPSYIKVDICSQKDWTGNANITIIGSYKYLEQTCVKHKCCGEIEQKLFFGDHLPQFPAFEQSSSSINSRRPDLKMSSRNLALKYIYFIWDGLIQQQNIEKLALKVYIFYMRWPHSTTKYWGVILRIIQFGLFVKPETSYIITYLRM